MVNAGASNGTSDGSTEAPADYASIGPYGATKTLLNQGLGTVTAAPRGSASGEQQRSERVHALLPRRRSVRASACPSLTWGNGTFCTPTFYDALIDHVVSYGFIVVATNTSNVGSVPRC